jgi:hypothetical protein|tara:strand:- start:1229 stop:2023 length:795 start_codon:yes stop_codon:yes gene_type:complete
MAGGATTKTTPWPTQEPYLEKGFQQAERIYDMNQGMGTPYFGGPTVAGFDPAQEAAQGGVLGYATGPRPGIMQAGTEQSLMRGLQGGQGVNYGAGSPFSAMMAKAEEQVRNKLTGETLPGIREAMVGTWNNPVQPGGGSRGNLLQEKAVSGAAKGFAEQIADQWGGAWNTAQAQVPDYMRMSGQVQQTPLGMYGAMADVGSERRAMTQEGINRSMAKHDWEQAAPQRALQNYLASVTGDYGSVVTQSQQPNFLGAIGGLLGGMI